MSKELILTLDNVSRCKSQLPALITRYEIEGDDYKEGLVTILATLCIVSVKALYSYKP